MAMLSLLARIGTSQPVEPIASLDELARDFDFAHFGRAPAHFDPHDVELLNARLLHKLDHRGCRGSASDECDGRGLAAAPTEPRAPVRFRALVRGAARRGRSARNSHTTSACSCVTRPAIAEGLDWKAEPWRSLTGELKTASGKKGRELFHPLRLALTGATADRKWPGLVERMGKDRTVQRLKAAAKR